MVQLLPGSSTAARIVGGFMAACMALWFVCVIAFTFAGSPPPVALLAFLAATMLAVLGCIIYLERNPSYAVNPSPEELGPEPRGR